MYMYIMYICVHVHASFVVMLLYEMQCAQTVITDHKLLAAGHSCFKAISVPAAVFLQLSKQSNE